MLAPVLGIAEKLVPDRLRPLTALQRHVGYFDPKRTGFVTLGNTARGIRDLGFGPVLSAVLTAIIHAALVPITGFNWQGRISVRAIDSGIHAGDTGIFGPDGELRPLVFEELFLATVGPDRAADPDALVTSKELRRFMLRDEGVSVGALFSFLEAELLLRVAASTPDGGTGGARAMTKRRLLQFYEGRLFHAIARWRRCADHARAASGPARGAFAWKTGR